LYAKFKALSESAEFSDYNIAQKKVIEHALRSFQLSGIALPKAQQAEFQVISQQLSKLNSQFSHHVLKSTQAWFKHITDESELAGLPESAKGTLKQLAEQKSLQGWCVTLDFPSYLAIMTYATNRLLREEVYRAFITRASDQADNTEFDNSTLMDDIRALRHKKAVLLGFEQYSELSLATKMAESTPKVLGFLRDLAVKSKPQAEQELASLKAFAKQDQSMTDVQPWDVAYLSEKLKIKRCHSLKKRCASIFQLNRS